MASRCFVRVLFFPLIGHLTSDLTGTLLALIFLRGVGPVGVREKPTGDKEEALEGSGSENMTDENVERSELEETKVETMTDV